VIDWADTPPAAAESGSPQEMRAASMYAQSTITVNR
jgi:hypothetical protein